MDELLVFLHSYPYHLLNEREAKASGLTLCPECKLESERNSVGLNVQAAKYSLNYLTITFKKNPTKQQQTKKYHQNHLPHKQRQ